MSAVSGRARRVLPLAALVVLLVACDVGGDGEDDRDAAVYEAVIRDVVGGRDDLRVVVHPLDEDREVDLAVQADLLDALDDLDDVRFVDEFADVVDEDEPGRPVRGDGVAVGLGPVEEDDDGVTVRASRYLRRGEAEGIEYAAEERDGGWRVERTGSFEPRLEVG